MTLLRRSCSGENHASFTDINFEKQACGQGKNSHRTTIVVCYFCPVSLLAPAGGSIRTDDPTANKRRVEPRVVMI
mgnify:CR=1 FL=1